MAVGVAAFRGRIEVPVGATTGRWAPGTHVGRSAIDHPVALAWPGLAWPGGESGVPLPCHNGVKQGGMRRYGLESLMPPDQVFCVPVLLRSTLRAAF